MQNKSAVLIKGWKGIEEHVMAQSLAQRAMYFEQYSNLRETPLSFLIKLHDSVKHVPDHPCFYSAVRNDRFALLPHLAKACKANINQKDDEGFSAVFLVLNAKTTGPRDARTVEFVLKTCDLNQESGFGTPVINSIDAEEHGLGTPAVRLLLEHGASANAQSDGRAPLHYAAMCDSDVELVQLLLKHGARVNELDRQQYTPLLHALARVPCCKFELIRTLVDAGADCNAAIDTGLNCIAVAVYKNVDMAVLDLLLSHGGDVNKQSRNGQTALGLAVSYDHADKLEWLLQHGAKATIKDKVGVNPFHIACLQNARLEIARMLLDSAPELLHVPDGGGNTPLHLAVEGNVTAAFAQLLLERGADVEARCNLGYTPKELASNSPFINHELKKLLLGSNYLQSSSAKSLESATLGMAPTPRLTQNLIEAIAQGNMTTTRLFVHHGAIINSGIEKTGQTPLMIALLAEADIECIKLLIQAGADVNLADALGATSMHHAAMNNVDVEIVKLLIKAGGDCDIPIKLTGDTPLHSACMMGASVELVTLLLAHQRSHRLNSIALKIAREKKHMDLVALLKQPRESFKPMEDLSLNFDFTFCTACRQSRPKLDLYPCSGCRMVSYCNEVCQRAHYYMHKSACKAVRRLHQQ